MKSFIHLETMTKPIEEYTDDELADLYEKHTHLNDVSKEPCEICEEFNYRFRDDYDYQDKIDQAEHEAARADQFNAPSEGF